MWRHGGRGDSVVEMGALVTGACVRFEGGGGWGCVPNRERRKPAPPPPSRNLLLSDQRQVSAHERSGKA
jgi:hypothetical protein